MVQNGRIPVSQMVIRQGLYLWPSTASKFDLMDAWLVSLGYPHMVITQPYGAYRSIADQIKVKAIYGAGAATPGYSNHGLGTAWDIYNIDYYPDAIIAQGAAKFNLRRDAGNGAGGIESWHLHDYDQTVPADSGDTPIAPSTIQNGNEMIRFLYADNGGPQWSVINMSTGRGLRAFTQADANGLSADVGFAAQTVTAQVLADTVALAEKLSGQTFVWA